LHDPYFPIPFSTGNFITIIQVRSDDLVNPTSRVLDKQREEVMMLATKAQLRKAKECHTREVLDVLDWGTGRIEDTPHGCFAKMMKEKPGPPKPATGTFKSVIPFDHYNVSRGKAVADAEFPSGKRIIPRLN
jgi:hypothetical protein